MSDNAQDYIKDKEGKKILSNIKDNMYVVTSFSGVM